jgi:hypothetical protein
VKLRRWLTQIREKETPAEARDVRPGGLLDVHTFLVDADVLSFTVLRLAEVGREKLEAFVLWGGQRRGYGVLEFTSAMYPRQKAYDTEDGLLVVVDDDSLFEVNKTFHERHEILAAQVHSHPTRAFHSDTDDAKPIVTLLGGLSVVVPDFAKHAHESRDGWAWYRLSSKAKWEPLSKKIRVEFR